ncbi:protein-L-isoaspartate(D-aspartate) O-methyltransferase [Jiella marina]|uniref:protein-L-isoaspartate(D-aspartate) O-methyltransferase n=1 Tax=Jiella sp. LLJ827 TaxID=2917712 RepID=UPI00210102E4|nr:protein-L-isoaspartate(D-aspartate) O-methyltransferase [Jiella sp. LLJ827]MCQ0986175.1 protein-L-isoaspartate(D-aspartate) O-methyltransferase [Jiella sp. LLJ827]
MKDAEVNRERMVRLIASRGVRDARVLAAMSEVPREAFVRPDLIDFAHEDAPLSIGEGQTISQPTMVALMLEAARIGPKDRVLEIGAGSGYAAAVISRLAREVHAIERLRSLGEKAAESFRRLGYENIDLAIGDGTKGRPDAAPYDAIVVSAAAERMPDSLKDQLAIGGRLIIPVGDRGRQTLKRITRLTEHRFDEEILANVLFVPLIADEEPPEPGRRDDP